MTFVGCDLVSSAAAGRGARHRDGVQERRLAYDDETVEHVSLGVEPEAGMKLTLPALSVVALILVLLAAPLAAEPQAKEWESTYRQALL